LLSRSNTFEITPLKSGVELTARSMCTTVDLGTDVHKGALKYSNARMDMLS